LSVGLLCQGLPLGGTAEVIDAHTCPCVCLRRGFHPLIRPF
jgi:hypothetical protein